MRRTRFAKLTRVEDLMEAEARFRHTGEYDKALQVLDRVLMIDPSSSHALNNKAALLMMAHEYDAALPVLERAAARDPANGQALSNLGTCYYALGRSESAVRYLRAALKAGYIHEGVNYNLALALFTLGNTTEALDQLEIVLKVNPFYEAALREVYRMGQATEVLTRGDPVDHTTVARIRSVIGNFSVAVSRGRGSTDAMLILKPKRPHGKRS